MSEHNRRQFLTTSAAAASSAIAFNRVVEAQTETTAAGRKPVRMLVMGVNGRGKQLIKGFLSFDHVEIPYIADPDKNVIASAVKMVTDRGRPEPKVIDDFREVLDQDDWDVLVC